MMDEGCRLGRMQFVGKAGFEAANAVSNLLGDVEIYEMGRIAMSLKGQEITNKALSDCCFS